MQPIPAEDVRRALACVPPETIKGDADAPDLRTAVRGYNIKLAKCTRSLCSWTVFKTTTNPGGIFLFLSQPAQGINKNIALIATRRAKDESIESDTHINRAAGVSKSTRQAAPNTNETNQNKWTDKTGLNGPAGATLLSTPPYAFVGHISFPVCGDRPNLSLARIQSLPWTAHTVRLQGGFGGGINSARQQRNVRCNAHLTKHTKKSRRQYLFLSPSSLVLLYACFSSSSSGMSVWNTIFKSSQQIQIIFGGGIKGNGTEAFHELGRAIKPSSPVSVDRHGAAQQEKSFGQHL